MKKTAILLMFVTLLSKVGGFLRGIVLAYFYGVSNVSDVYLISLTIPAVVFAFVGSGINTSYIPLYTQIEKKLGIEEGKKYTNNVINFILILATLMSILVMIFTEPVVKMFASGFEGEILELATFFTRITIVAVYFTGIDHVLQGYLNVRGKFIIPSIVGVPYNFLVIIAIIISYKSNLTVLAIGSVLAFASKTLIMLISAYKQGYRFQLYFNIKDEYLKKMCYLAFPVILGTSVTQINQLIDRTLASRLEVGGISALTYAHSLDNFIYGIFVLSIATVMYPNISKMAAEHDMGGLKKSINEAIVLVNLLIIPVTVGAMVFSIDIVMFLFGRGAFGQDAIYLTSNAMFYYSIGMIGFGLRAIAVRVFYSLQDTKTPMINSAIGMVLNIVLNFVLSIYIGIAGLALATSITELFTMVLMYISLRNKIGSFGMKKITIVFSKILMASAFMGMAAKISFDLLLNYLGQNMSLIFTIGIGAVVYFILVYFMRVEEVQILVNIISKKKLIKSET